MELIPIILQEYHDDTRGCFNDIEEIMSAILLVKNAQDFSFQYVNVGDGEKEFQKRGARGFVFIFHCTKTYYYVVITTIL